MFVLHMPTIVWVVWQNMTTLVAWISYSSTGERPELPRAIYIAADSRITWGSQAQRWDAGRKVFNPSEEPHVFGYCGDVVFPSLVLGQVITAIDKNILFETGSTPDRKHQLILELMKNSFQRRHNAPDQNFSIVHAFRQSSWPKTAFSFWHIEYEAMTQSWFSNKIPLPDKTQMLISLGAGASSAKDHVQRWEKSDAGGTSRSIFSAFCDAIDTGSNRLSGGPPQLSALYSDLPPKSLGVVKNGSFYLHGLQVPPGPKLSKIEWCDELFQRVNPKNMKRAKGARRFVRPEME